EVRQPYHRWILAIARVLLAVAQGRIGEVDALAQQALEAGQESQNQNATLVFAIQTGLTFREQGRTQELEMLLASFVPLYPLILPTLRCCHAVICADQGREAEARSEFESLA